MARNRRPAARGRYSAAPKAQPIQKIEYENETAIVTQDYLGRITIKTEEETPIRASIKTNSGALMTNYIFASPRLPSIDADYLMKQGLPRIDGRGKKVY